MDRTPPQNGAGRVNALLDATTLAQKIESSPELLGLGMGIPVFERIIEHPGDGRFAVVLSDPADGSRHVVEVQLGDADEDQLLRALTRWASERRSVPDAEHHAAVVAERIPPSVARAVAMARRIAPIEALELAAEQRGEALELRAELVEAPLEADPGAELASALRLRRFLESLDPSDPLAARLMGPRPTTLDYPAT